MGISLLSHPTKKLKLIFSQWMGCGRFIWNAKCDEDKYLTRFAQKYMPIGTYAPIDQAYSRYKDPELSPWLFNCPSQILRNSASNWYQTYQNYLKGLCGKPRRKKKGDEESIHLTRELFYFEKCQDGVTRLSIGTKKHFLGYLSLKNHAPYKEPNSIYIKKRCGKYYVSFCYEDGIDEKSLPTSKEHLECFKDYTKEELEKITVGIDRGVARPVQADSLYFDYTEEQKRKKKNKQRYLKRCQRALSRRKKGSKRRERTKRKIARGYEKISNIRKDFCHKTSRTIIDAEETKIVVLEDLKTHQMTRRPKAKKDKLTGNWENNGSKRKSRLNRSILDIGWHQLETFLKYKAHRAKKAVFKIPAYYTSQECADCGHTHPNNRKKRDLFVCESCGHTDHADHNATKIIKKRAIKLITDSGTELSKRYVLLDRGRGAIHKTPRAKALCARSKETSKKKGSAQVA